MIPVMINIRLECLKAAIAAGADASSAVSVATEFLGFLEPTDQGQADIQHSNGQQSLADT